MPGHRQVRGRGGFKRAAPAQAALLAQLGELNARNALFHAGLVHHEVAANKSIVAVGDRRDEDVARQQPHLRRLRPDQGIFSETGYEKGSR